MKPDASFRDLVQEDGIQAGSGPLSEQDEVQPLTKRSVIAKVSAKRKSKKRAKNKAKAEKAFLKSYGATNSTSGGLNARSGSGASGSTESEGGPRAAVYKGKMGSSQKKASSMQSKSSPLVSSKGFSPKRTFEVPSFSKKITIPAFTLVIVALFAFALYPPAQQYYTQMREVERLSAEYAAIEARNQAIQDNIDALQTDEGIEDKAHSEFGYVKQNEKTASVAGIDVEEKSDFAANIVPGSIPAPQTWYSGFLDAFFMYDAQPVKLDPSHQS